MPMSMITSIVVVARSRRELAKRLETSTDAAQKMRKGFVRNDSAARRRRIHIRRVLALRTEPLISPFLPNQECSLCGGFEEVVVMKHAVPTLGFFLRRIAIDYMRYGYYRWALRFIPPERDPQKLDAKLIDAYGVTACRTTRMRQRRQGLAVVQYVRWEHTFVLLATEGTHEQFGRLRSYDAREAPLHIGAYTIGYRASSHVVVVQVRQQVWLALSKRIHLHALSDRAAMEMRINSLPFYRFPGVTGQLRDLVKAINQRRRVAGLPLIVINYGTRWDPHSFTKQTSPRLVK